MLILSIPFLNPEFVKDHSPNNIFTWKEYRLDYQKSLNDFPLEILDTSSIVTIRDIKEGGINDISKQQKNTFYQKVISKYNCLVDYEIQLYESDLIDPVNLVLSYHDFDVKPDFKKLEQIIQMMNETNAKFVKIAISINSYSGLYRISQLIKTMNKPLILAGMGRLGKLSRLLYKHLGAAGTFIGLNENPTAPGQLTENDLNIFNLHRITHRTLVGGIIGGEQVDYSLGLKFYNDHFQQNDLDAVFLPFAVEDISDFQKWADSCDFKDRFYGFSVTMPFKRKILKNETINLFLPHKNRFLNTDKEGFNRSLESVFVKRTDRILIVGCGGSAHKALEVFAIFPNVTISCRSTAEGEKLAQEFDYEFTPFDLLTGKEFDLIVNCTPIGMKGEDFLELTKIGFLKKVIDLPYREENTLLIEHCISYSLPYVDGKMFWKWQAERQLAEFVKEINKC